MDNFLTLFNDFNNRLQQEHRWDQIKPIKYTYKNWKIIARHGSFKFRGKVGYVWNVGKSKYFIKGPDENVVFRPQLHMWRRKQKGTWSSEYIKDDDPTFIPKLFEYLNISYDFQNENDIDLFNQKIEEQILKLI